MPAGDKGGVIAIKPLTTHAITAWSQLIHSMRVTNTAILRRAKKQSYASRRGRGT